MNNVLNRLAVAGMMAASLAMVACSDQTGLNASSRTSLSFVASSGKDVLGDPVPPQNPMVVSGHTIVVNSVELTLSKIELKGEADHETEIKGTTVIVGVPANGSLVTPVSANVEAGSYDKLEMKVQTVHVTGTFDGQPFDVTAAVNEDLETIISPPLVVAQSGPANVTVTIDMANWFRNADGSALDLRSADTTIMARLAANIASSFEAFEDHDHDGHSDDSEHSGGDN